MPAKKTTGGAAPSTAKQAPASKQVPAPKQAVRPPPLKALLANELYQDQLKAVLCAPAFNIACHHLAAAVRVSMSDLVSLPAEVVARKAAFHAAIETFPEMLAKLIGPRHEHSEPEPWAHINPSLD